MTTSADMDAAIERILKATCAAQGVPLKVTDPAVVAKVAALAKTSTPNSPSSGSPSDEVSPTGRRRAAPPSREVQRREPAARSTTSGGAAPPSPRPAA